MCDFCSFGPNSNQNDKDSLNCDFAGFFSSDAINAAISQSQVRRRNDTQDDDDESDDEDEDGT